MKVKQSIILLQLLLFGFTCFGQTPQQNSEAKALSSSEYRLSPAAVAAGIEGKVQIGLTINADGKASDIRIYGGPMWPCGTHPKAEIEEVRKGVRKHILATKFASQVKGGKARSVSAQITFLLTDAFKRAANKQQASDNNSNPVLIDVGQINTRAVSLQHPFDLRPNTSATILELQVLVDENGNVVSAGGFRGEPRMQIESLEAACKSKFKPDLVNGKPVKMTGILTYFLR